MLLLLSLFTLRVAEPLQQELFSPRREPLLLLLDLMKKLCEFFVLGVFGVQSVLAVALLAVGQVIEHADEVNLCVPRTLVLGHLNAPQRVDEELVRNINNARCLPSQLTCGAFSGGALHLTAQRDDARFDL